ncbi:phage tail assembly protein [uncultured Dialister sp.]|jgi:hypothetical protein|uniref:phage tail assembly protein n=1 Tax=uncultured Dialister sp. TaxID=278064 RepID=UPI0020586F8B|nr:phage tail assembly protein [uncultured Dialister sp.]DAV65427.1 MAG TPA: tail assembly chaperone protein [Caudoviricetes sp.]
MKNLIKLKKTVTINGKEIKEVDLDFDKLTGEDMVKAEREARSMGVAEGSVFASMKYQAILCAKVIGCPVDDVLRLPGEDFKNLVRQAATFLLA